MPLEMKVALFGLHTKQSKPFSIMKTTWKNVPTIQRLPGT